MPIEGPKISQLACTTCEYRATAYGNEYTCPVDEGVLDVEYDYRAIHPFCSKETLKHTQDYYLWRYKELLPVSNSSLERYAPPLPVGGTPLHAAPLLGQRLGMEQILIKDDTRNPTGSLKDRASAIAVVRAQEEGKKVIAAASTGNAASSVAGLSASVHLPCVIFVPHSTPQEKLCQSFAYGAQVICIDGTYDDAYELCERACEKYDWYNRNTAKNPYLSEGKKTVSFEICEQMGWNVPDVVIVPVGDGCVIGGVWKGFMDFYKMGFIQRLPRIIGVQPKGSNALCQAYHQGKARAGAVHAHTIADSLSVDLPKDDVKALKAVRESNGTFVEVTDEEIQEAQLLLARSTGIFAESSSCTTVAAVRHMLGSGQLESSEKTVLLVTGSGLKNTEVISRQIQSIPVIPRTGEGLEQLIDSYK